MPTAMRSTLPSMLPATSTCWAGVTESEYTGYTINAYRDFIAADGV